MALGSILPRVASSLSSGVTELGAISVSVERDVMALPTSPSMPPEPPPAPAPAALEAPRETAVEKPIEKPIEKPDPPPDVPVEILPTSVLDEVRLRAPPAIDAPAPPPPQLASPPPVETIASRGEIEQFARGVALAISAKRPKGVGQKGRVEIELKLSLTGHVDVVRVSRSSGSPRLDALATATIERASYPVPPAGLQPADLTFRVPFTFE